MKQRGRRMTVERLNELQDAALTGQQMNAELKEEETKIYKEITSRLNAFRKLLKQQASLNNK